MQINATITQTTDNSIILLADNWMLRLHVEPTRFIFYCFTSHVYYFRLEIYNKTIIGFSFCFFPLEMYNKTIIGFGFCGMQDYQCLGKNYHPCVNIDNFHITILRKSLNCQHRRLELQTQRDV